MADDENSASSYTVSSNDLFCMHLAILGHGSVDHGLTKAHCQILSVNRDFNVS